MLLSAATPRTGEGWALGSAHGRRRHRGGSRPRRAGRRRRARRRRPAGRRRRPGERGQPRRPGALVLRRAVPRRQPRAAPDGHPATRSSWPGRTGRAAPASTGRRGPLAARSGRRPTSTSRPARSAPGCTSRGCGGSPSSAGPSAATAARAGTATPCRGSTSPGAPGPACWSRSCAACASSVAAGRVELRHRHRVDELVVTDGAVTGVRGTVLAADAAGRGRPTEPRGRRRLRAQRPGGRRHLRRHRRQPRPGPGQLARAASAPPPEHMLTGVPAYVDGRMLAIAEAAGGRGHQPRPDVALRRGHPQLGPRSGRGHAIRILPGPELDVVRRHGDRLPAPLFPGFDTLGTLAHLRRTGHDHTWFILTHKIIGKEFALSGSEQNPDLTGKSVSDVLGRARADMPETGAGLPRPAARTSCRRPALARARRQDERPHPRAAPRRGATSSARSSTATARSTTSSARTPR